MIRFECDYTDGCAPEVLEELIRTNGLNTIGYGNDEFCAAAKEKIKTVCKCPQAEIHFAVGGTQANTIIISSILRNRSIAPAEAFFNSSGEGIRPVSGNRRISSRSRKTAPLFRRLPAPRGGACD